MRWVRNRVILLSLLCMECLEKMSPAGIKGLVQVDVWTIFVKLLSQADMSNSGSSQPKKKLAHCLEVLIWNELTIAG
jgi:hypothetical protein